MIYSLFFFFLIDEMLKSNLLFQNKRTRFFFYLKNPHNLGVKCYGKNGSPPPTIYTF